MTGQPAPEAPVVLTEYDSVLVQLSTGQARELRRAAGGAVTVQPDDTAGTWRITSSHYVGTITAGGTRVLITPKLEISSLFYLLEASGKPVATGPAIFSYGTTRRPRPGLRHLLRPPPRDSARPRHPPRLPRDAGAPAGDTRPPGHPGAAPPGRPAAARRMRLRRVHRRHPAHPRAPRRSPAAAAAAWRDRPDPAGATAPGRPPRAKRALCTRQDLRTPTAFTRLDEHCRPAEHLARMVLGNQTLRCAAGHSRRVRLPHRHEHRLRGVRGGAARPLPRRAP